MKRIRNFMIWTLIFIGLLLAFDLLMVRSAPLPAPFGGVQRFYVEFRSRLLALGRDGTEKVTIETVIESTGGADAAAGGSPDRKEQRYLYADDQGVLHFADSLAEVPQPYRDAAQPLAE